VEEVKWRGAAVWSHDGIICVANAFKDKVKLIFYLGSSLPDPDKLFNNGLEGKQWRTIDFYHGDKINEPALKTLIRAAVNYNRDKVKPPVSLKPQRQPQRRKRQNKIIYPSGMISSIWQASRHYSVISISAQQLFIFPKSKQKNFYRNIYRFTGLRYNSVLTIFKGNPQMFNADKMLGHELTFCQLFTNKVTTEYGIIYYNPLNPFSHDSNHAHILDIANNPEAAIRDIVAFYRNYGLVPRVYCSFIAGELTQLRPYLESQGFTVTMSNVEFMVFPHPFSANLDTTLPVRRITGLPDDIIELIRADDTGDWTVNVLKNPVNHENFHLLGLFEHDRRVAIASVQVMVGYSRIDNVVTFSAFRGQHFGTRLISYLVNYHAALSGNYLYLFADNPIAIRLYKNVGFRTVTINKPCWNAHLPA